MGKINITLAVDGQEEMVLPMEVDDDDSLASLQQTAEGITGVPASKQVLLRGNQVISGDGSLKAAGISEGDVIMLLQQPVQPQRPPPQRQAHGDLGDGSALYAQNTDGSFVHPEEVIARILGNPQAMADFRARAPAQAAAVERRDVSELQALMRQRHVKAQAPVDEMDPEYQRKAIEAIQQQAIQDNYEHAMEYTPEVFGSVDMLYVDMAANNEPLKVFVDSGAQMTIMTQTCAEKCNLMRLVDKRFEGIAVGVGQNKIIGRIHACNLKVGDQFIATSITVLEQKTGPQFIFGLENMRRHQCIIDLPANMLRIGSCNVTLPFLPEHEVPKDFNIERQTTDMDKTADADAPGSPQAAGGRPPAPRASSQVAGDRAGSTAGSHPPGGAAGASAGGAGPQRAPQGGGAGASAVATGTSAGAGAASDAAVQQLMSITGQSAEQCQRALQATGGNVDLAASMLLGF